MTLVRKIPSNNKKPRPPLTHPRRGDLPLRSGWGFSGGDLIFCIIADFLFLPRTFSERREGAMTRPLNSGERSLVLMCTCVLVVILYAFSEQPRDVVFWSLRNDVRVIPTDAGKYVTM